MALLIFPPDNLANHPTLAGLLDPSLRETVATQVNAAILGRWGYATETRLKGLVQLRTWAERRAREQGRELPKEMGLWVEGEEDGGEGEDSLMSGNGEMEGEPMAT